MAFGVVLDTCVLYPAYLRDTLLRLASADTYRPLWSAQILDELARAMDSPIGAEQAARVVDLMASHFTDAEVTGHEDLESSMTNDPKDRHVLAAAVRAGAQAIVTFNTRDFPDGAVRPYGIEVLTPDAFLLNQLDLAPGAVMRVLQQQVAGYREPRMDLYALASALARCGCPAAAEELRLLIDGA